MNDVGSVVNQPQPLLPELVEEMTRAVGAHLYVGALFIAVSLPDICGSLTSASGQASGVAYARWFDENMHAGYTRPIQPGSAPLFSGETCYRYRCTMLHQGSSVHPKSPYSRIFFTVPGQSSISHMNSIASSDGTILTVDVAMFCADMSAAVLTWYSAHKVDATVQRNLHTAMHRYPAGMVPPIGLSSIG